MPLSCVLFNAPAGRLLFLLAQEAAKHGTAACNLTVEAGTMAAILTSDWQLCRVIVARIAHLVKHAQSPCPPHTIVAVSFTNKAASELKQRVLSALGGVSSLPCISTFHALCARYLRAFVTACGLCDLDGCRR